MKLLRTAALALAVAVTPAYAGPGFFVDFEKTWDFSNGAIENYYNGGTAADGTSGPNQGVSFANFSGLSNDALGPYYSGAPSPQGVAYTYSGGLALLNVAAGVGNAISFFYSSPSAVVGAVRAFSGVDGTGALLGSFNLVANDANGGYDSWTQALFSFAGTARSFDFTNTADLVAFDNILAIPEPGILALLFAGGAAALIRRRRTR